MTLYPADLRTEYRRDPVGIGEFAPRFSWKPLPLDMAARGLRQSGYRILVSSSLESLEQYKGDLWDSGKIDSPVTIHVEYAGRPLKSHQDCWWSVILWDGEGNPSPWANPARFVMGLRDPAREWKGKWIREPEEFSAKYRMPGENDLVLAPVPRFVKSFNVRREPRHARLYATAFGCYSLWIDGAPIAPFERLHPGWTDYRRRVYYHTYDLGGYFARGGKHRLEADLADGWYAGYVAWGRKRERYGRIPLLSLFLRLEYEDGSIQTVTSDETWTVRESVIRHADILMGERHDLRLRDDQLPNWGAAVTVPTPKVELQAAPSDPVCEQELVTAKSVTTIRPGVVICDMGQNLVGVPEVSLEVRAGEEIRFRFAEMLNPDGTIYTDNLRDARATDSLVPAWDDAVFWSPTHTFHGFRYIEVTGLSAVPPLDGVGARVLHSDLERAVSFDSSHPSLNRLVENIRWGMRGNYLEIPTDCPQRDERLGWTGDAQVFIGTACHMMNVAAFFTKWLVDVRDAQRPDGSYTDVAPDIGLGAGTAGWGDAGIICPWTIWRHYGDRRLLERSYDSMCRYIAYLESASDSYRRPAEGYGDWLSLNADTPKDLIGTAYFARVTSLMAEIAGVLGKQADRRRFLRLRRAIGEAFNEGYIKDDGTLATGTQTACVLALAFDLPPEDRRESVFNQLIRDIHLRGGHLSTGFLGTPHLLPVLTRFGRADIAYQLLLNEDFPSWLWQVRAGATTMWEHWDSWHREFGFKDPFMNSFNHYAFGAVGEWIFRHVCGVDLSDIHRRRVMIHPLPGGGLTHAGLSHESIHGTIQSSWRLYDGEFHLNVLVPPNCTASVVLPADVPQDVRESNLRTGRARDVRFAGVRTGGCVYTVGSGFFEFACRWRGGT